MPQRQTQKKELAFYIPTPLIYTSLSSTQRVNKTFSVNDDLFRLFGYFDTSQRTPTFGIERHEHGENTPRYIHVPICILLRPLSTASDQPTCIGRSQECTAPGSHSSILQLGRTDPDIYLRYTDESCIWISFVRSAAEKQHQQLLRCCITTSIVANDNSRVCRPTSQLHLVTKLK